MQGLIKQMEITWQVAPHVCLNPYSSGNIYCALTGRAGYGDGSLLFHGWASVEVGLNAESLTPSPLHATSKERVSEGCGGEHRGGTGKEPGITAAWKGRGMGSGAGQKPSPLASCISLCSPAPHSHPGVLLPLKNTEHPQDHLNELSSLPIFCANKPPAACQPGSCVLYVEYNF